MAQQKVEKKCHVATQAYRILAREKAALDQSREPRRGSGRLDTVFQGQQPHDLHQRLGRTQLEIDGILVGPIFGNQLPEQINTTRAVMLQPGDLREERQIIPRRGRDVTAQGGASSGEPEIARKSKKISVNMIS